MRKVANYDLWIGNVGDLDNPREILNHGIQAIVELADNEPMAVLPRDLIRCRFPITDGDEERLWLLRLATETTAALVQSEVPVLVCCSSGMNRSNCIAAAALVTVEGISPTVALKAVTRDSPSDVSPALFSRVLEAVIGSNRST